MKVSDNGKGYILKSGSYMTNHGNAEIGTGSVYVYGDNAGEIINNASSISMTGSNSVGFYLTNSGNVTNKADITGLSTGNVGIYSDKGSITNSGNIVLGDSMIIDPDDSSKNNYSVGIYAKGAEVANTGNIKTGTRGTGIYKKITNKNKPIKPIKKIREPIRKSCP